MLGVKRFRTPQCRSASNESVRSACQLQRSSKGVEALCRLFPGADLFTLFYDPERVSPLIRSHRVTASFLNPLSRHYRAGHGD